MPNSEERPIEPGTIEVRFGAKTVRLSAEAGGDCVIEHETEKGGVKRYRLRICKKGLSLTK